MTSPRHPAPSVPTALPACIALFALLALAALFPPEARGESMAGCAALIALAALLQWRGAARSAGRAQGLLLLGSVLAVFAGRAALAPGAAVEPVAVVILAAAAAIAAAALPGDQAPRRQLVVATAVSAAVVSVHALYQKLWGFDRMLRELAGRSDLPDQGAVLAKLEGGRAFAGFITPAGLGGFLALALPLTVALALESRGPKRAAWAALALLETAAFVATASATATAALLGATALAALAWSRRRRAMLIGMAVLGLLLVAVALQRGGVLLDPGASHGPWRERAGNFRAAWEMAGDHPLAGTGPGGFSELYPAYRRPGDNETRHVHNLPLELAADTGWPAAALITLWVFYLFCRPIWVERRAGPAWRKGLAIGLASFALHNLGDFTFYMPSMLWIAATLLGAFTVREGDPAPAVGGGLRRAVSGASLAGVLLAALAAALSGLAADARLAARYASHAGDTEATLGLSALAARLAPWDPDAALLHARATAAGRGERGSALRRADRAVTLSPVRPAARALRGRLRLTAGDLEGAFADFSAAARLYPEETRYARGRDDLRSKLGRLSTQATEQP